MTDRVFIDSGLADKVVIVTGGSRGIGRAIVELFAAEGAAVSFFFRESRVAADEVVESASQTGKAITAERVDVRDAGACAAAVNRIADRCGRIDVLVNNSGIIRDNLLERLHNQPQRERATRRSGGNGGLTVG